MRDPWRLLVESVLVPARPHLTRCLRERAAHLEARRLAGEARTRAIAECEARIEGARARVFAANDGVVGARMTELEREWRRLSRLDPEAGLMDLWARIAPASWIDRKRWRDSPPAVRLDAAIALAADWKAVDAAEAAVASLRAALAPWGTAFGPRVRFRLHARDVALSLLDEPLRAALASEDRAASRAEGVACAIERAACDRFPERPLLAHDLGRAALIDHVPRRLWLGERPDPIAPLLRLWATGYTLSEADADGVIVEIPPL